MISLLLSTLAMMGLTFLIGFFVAAVIKLIATAADSFDFYSTHRRELLRLHRWQRMRRKVEVLVRQTPFDEEDLLDDGRGDYSRGINKEIPSYRQGYYHGVSHGAAQQDLMDYYYPEDTRVVFLEEEAIAHKVKKEARKTNTNNQK